MAASTTQIDEIATAARWLEARQQEVMPGFRLQQVTVHVVADPDGDPDGDYAEVKFQWVGDHYTFTVSP
jgi:hypothetical protein